MRERVEEKREKERERGTAQLFLLWHVLDLESLLRRIILLLLSTSFSLFLSLPLSLCFSLALSLSLSLSPSLSLISLSIPLFLSLCYAYSRFFCDGTTGDHVSQHNYGVDGTVRFCFV